MLRNTLLDNLPARVESRARVNTPDQHDFYDPDPVSEFGSLQRLQSHIAQMAPHQQERNSGRLLIWAEKRLRELSESNQMAARHMARDREHAARLESQLDALKNQCRLNPEMVKTLPEIVKDIEDRIQMRCERGHWQSYSDLEAERNRLLSGLLEVVKAAQSVMPEGKP